MHNAEHTSGLIGDLSASYRHRRRFQSSRQRMGKVAQLRQQLRSKVCLKGSCHQRRRAGGTCQTCLVKTLRIKPQVCLWSAAQRTRVETWTVGHVTPVLSPLDWGVYLRPAPKSCRPCSHPWTTMPCQSHRPTTKMDDVPTDPEGCDTCIALFDGETLPKRVEICSHEGPGKC